MSKELELKEIEELIYVRREPHIYAFSTNTIPNYIKVGDTSQVIDDRLNQWRNKANYENMTRLFPSRENEELGTAKVDKHTYFRDYELHHIFEEVNPNSRLTRPQLEALTGNANVYYSNEFFKDISVDDIKNGIETIKNDYLTKGNRFKFFDINKRAPIDVEWSNDKDWKLRDNQLIVVNSFIDKVKTHNELLMYAVMRFGKSFTALSCAEQMGYKSVLVVSAKAEVLGEWKKTTQMPKCFKKYKFIYDRHFKEDPNIIENTLLNTEEKNRVVVFLTLQNLHGKDSSGFDIKTRLEKVFETDFDLLIIDETHFGVWNTELGKSVSKEEDETTLKYNKEEFEKFIEYSKIIKAKVKLHLSGTPYNLLYSKKFTDDNIIASCQFSDILKEKEKWESEHFEDIEVGNVNPVTGLPYEEFDNPYFGFPKMLRFAFNLPEKTKKKLAGLSDEHGKWRLNDLFVTKKKNGKTVFVHQEDVLNLFKIIDGTETDDSILSFLDIPKIKNNDVCKHIVVVLPFKNSCDALADLLSKKSNFTHLSEYKVLNVAGHNSPRELYPVEQFKSHISNCEKSGKKTITLTVNMLLTGVTVEEWDTMIMLKNTKSPQEYDQAIYRIQNQFVKEYTDKDGRTLKKDMKPQTILVDFDPLRMFELQGLSTRIVNSVKNEGNKLDEKLEEELMFFPIITYNGKKIVKVEPNNIVEIISNYNKEKSIVDEAKDVDFDDDMLDDSLIAEYIAAQAKANLSNGFKSDVYTGDEEDIETDVEGEAGTGSKEQGDKNKKNTSKPTPSDKKILQEFRKKYAMCVTKLLFYSFLTKTRLYSLKDLLNSLEDEHKEDNNRIFSNLGLNVDFIKRHISKCKKVYAFKLDEKIASINMLSCDASLTKEERITNALNRFNRISDSEVITPLFICEKTFDLIDESNLLEIIKNGGNILDISSKTGEYSVALLNKLRSKVDEEKIKNALYCVPTSSVSYEFTRKMYEVLGIPVNHICNEKTTALDLIKIVDKNDDVDYKRIKMTLTQTKMFGDIKIDDEVEDSERMIKFDAVIGNPPYQEESQVVSESNNQNPRTNIFHLFQNLAIEITEKYSVLIYPGIRWLHRSGKGKGFKDFCESLINDCRLAEIIFYPDASKVFKGVGFADGLTIVKIDKNKTEPGYMYRYLGEEEIAVKLNNPGQQLPLINPKDIQIAEKIKKVIVDNGLKYLNEGILTRSLFDIDGDFIVKNAPSARKYEKGDKLAPNQIKVLTNDVPGPGGRSYWFVVDKDVIPEKGKRYVGEWQVVVSSAHPGGQDGRDNQLEIADNKSAFGRSRLALKSFRTKREATNFYKYMKTDFVKFALFLSDESLTSLAKFVPDLIDYTDSNTIVDFNKDLDEQLFSLFDLESEKSYIIEAVK